MGHPIVWTPEKRENAISLIIGRICNGDSCRSILDNADRDIYPSFVTFCEWLKVDVDLAKQYARACEIRAESIFDEILQISDESNADLSWDEKGNIKVDGEAIQRSRLKIDTRKWVLGKLNPKKYSDKIQVDNNHSGTVSVINLGSGVSPDEDNV